MHEGNAGRACLRMATDKTLQANMNNLAHLLAHSHVKFCFVYLQVNRGQSLFDSH